MWIRLAGLSRAEEAGEIDSALGVEEPCALRQHVVIRIHLRGVFQNRFDEVRGQRGIRLQHQCNAAGNHRGRHARAAEADVRLVAKPERSAQKRRDLRSVNEAERIAE